MKKLSTIRVQCVKQVAVAGREKDDLGLVKSVLDKREKALLGVDDVVGGGRYPSQDGRPEASRGCCRSRGFEVALSNVFCHSHEPTRTNCVHQITN